MYEHKIFTVLGREWLMTYYELEIDQPLGLSANTACPIFPGCPVREMSCDYSGEGADCVPSSTEG
jgi:hypothetical protein